MLFTRLRDEQLPIDEGWIISDVLKRL